MYELSEMPNDDENAYRRPVTSMMVRSMIWGLLTAASSPTLASPFEQIKGSWNGAVQLNASHQPSAHSVGRLSVHIGTDGAFDGVHQSGCKVSGIVQRA